MNDLSYFSAEQAEISTFQLVLIIALALIVIISTWKIFEKAGKPGWAALIPIYNVIILLDIVGRPRWWIILFLIPIANIIASVIVVLELAKSFGKGVGFALGLLFLNAIFIPILAFGGATYQGNSVEE